MLDIITAESSQRPDGSPPTYDDAMKFVNEAFENSDDSDVRKRVIIIILNLNI